MAPEEILDLLAARSYGYLLFQRLFGSEPTGQLFQAVDAQVSAEAFAIMGGAESDLAECGAKMQAGIDAAVKNLETLKDSYVRLFVGPAALPAPPWESVYTSHKRLIMQPSTLEIRNAYRARGFIPALYPHVPDDHLALELHFMARLAEESLRACEEGNTQQARETLEASKAFLVDHLGAWVGLFAEKLREKEEQSVYAAIARALASFIAADTRRLDEMLKAL